MSIIHPILSIALEMLVSHAGCSFFLYVFFPCWPMPMLSDVPFQHTSVSNTCCIYMYVQIVRLYMYMHVLTLPYESIFTNKDSARPMFVDLCSVHKAH